MHNPMTTNFIFSKKNTIPEGTLEQACMRCKVIFRPCHARNFFCSARCREAFSEENGLNGIPTHSLRKTASQVECQTCAETFSSLRPPEKYCSSKCRVHAENLAKLEEHKQADTPRNRPQTFNCLQCKSDFIGFSKVAKFCAQVCRQQYYKATREPNISCDTCSKEFFKEPAKIPVDTKHFCCRECQFIGNRVFMAQEGVANWKGRTVNPQGYAFAPPGLRSQFRSMHEYLATTTLNLDRIPKGFDIHHKDCDKGNNDLLNLAVMDETDHHWIHDAYGFVALEALYKGQLDLEFMIGLCADKERARKLLTLNLLNQTGEEVMAQWRVKISSSQIACTPTTQTDSDHP